jgi:hypothetical protein
MRPLLRLGHPAKFGSNKRKFRQAAVRLSNDDQRHPSGEPHKLKRSLPKMNVQNYRRQRLLPLGVLIALVAMTVTARAADRTPNAPGKRPNILIISGDDLSMLNQ